MRFFINSMVLLALPILCCNSYADEVVFENGERLIGTFRRVEGKKLLFKSETVGEVSVNISEVKNVSADKPLEILLEDGTLLKGKTINREGSTFSVKEKKEGAEQSFVKADLYDIYPAPRPKVKWSGNLSAGFKSSHGSSFAEDTSLDWSFQLRNKKHRFRQAGWLRIERAKDTTGEKITTEENFTIIATYAYFITEKIFGYWGERFKKDHIDDLEYRLTSAWGGGYQWSETEKLDFYNFIGLGYLQEKYDSRIPNPNYSESNPAGEKKWLKDIKRRNDIILHTGYHFEWKPFSKIHCISNLAYSPSIDDWGDYNLTHDSELRAFITNTIYFTFKFFLDYDPDPGEDSSSTDTDYMLGLGWKF